MTRVTGNRFPPTLRLRKRREYLATYEQGVRVSGPRLVLFIRPRDEGGPRLGLTATRKVGHAAQRNRARRQLRESFRAHRSAFGAWDMVVNVRQSAVGVPTAEITAELLRLAARGHRAVARQTAEPRP